VDLGDLLLGEHNDGCGCRHDDRSNCGDK
jgi:hypothetical protein